MFVVVIIPERRSDPCPHSLRGSGRGGAGLLSEDPAPTAYVLGKWLRRERQRLSIRLRAYPSNTTICVRPPPGGVKGLRSHFHASRRAIYARFCKWTSENPLLRRWVNKDHQASLRLLVDQEHALAKAAR